MFSEVLAGFITFASAGLLLYFSVRTYLLSRATDVRIAAALDRDLKNGRRLWLAIRSLISPLSLVSVA